MEDEETAVEMWKEGEEAESHFDFVLAVVVVSDSPVVVRRPSFYYQYHSRRVHRVAMCEKWDCPKNRQRRSDELRL